MLRIWFVDTFYSTGTTGKFIMKDGELVPGSSQKEAQYFMDKRIDPADYERHLRLLR